MTARYITPDLIRNGDMFIPATTANADYRALLASGVTVTPWAEPTPEEALAAWRATATKDRGLLCLAMFDGGLLSGPSALAAARGDWPAEFDPFLAGLTTAEQLSMQIAWADAPVVRYQNPLLQGAALAHCEGDAAAAATLLDSLFGAP